MSVHVIRGQKIVARLGKWRWWAERGMVRMQHDHTGEYRALQWRDAFRKVKAINKMVKTHVRRNRRQNEHNFDTFDAKAIKEHMDFVRDMLEVCEQARFQGSPDNPQAVAEWRSRRPKALTIPVSPTSDPNFL